MQLADKEQRSNEKAAAGPLRNNKAEKSIRRIKNECKKRT
jgi:hypothetical protein